MTGKQSRGGYRTRESDCTGDRQADYRPSPDAKLGAFGTIVAVIVASITLSMAGPAAATDLLYVLRSPSFGGANAAPFQYEQFEKTLREQRAAAARAAATASAATTTDLNQQFANAIISQLNSLVARNIALRIADSRPGDAGTIVSGNVSITFINSDGQLNIVITTPTGSTSLSIPTGE